MRFSKCSERKKRKFKEEYIKYIKQNPKFEESNCSILNGLAQ